jgi:hypothetical protein
MSEKTLIKNKYDVYHVNEEIQNQFKQYIENNFQSYEVETLFFMRWIIRLVLGLCILYSYFHSLPFPLDKPLILLCTAIYFVLDFSLVIFDKFVTQNFKMFFLVSGKKSGTNVSQLKNFKENVKIGFKSDIPLFSNECKMEVKVGDKKSEEKINYNDYIYTDGEMCEEKLGKIFAKLLKDLQ